MDEDVESTEAQELLDIPGERWECKPIKSTGTTKLFSHTLSTPVNIWINPHI